MNKKFVRFRKLFRRNFPQHSKNRVACKSTRFNIDRNNLVQKLQRFRNNFQGSNNNTTQKHVNIEKLICHNNEIRLWIKILWDFANFSGEIFLSILKITWPVKALVLILIETTWLRNYNRSATTFKAGPSL